MKRLDNNFCVKNRTPSNALDGLKKSQKILKHNPRQKLTFSRNLLLCICIKFRVCWHT